MSTHFADDSDMLDREVRQTLGQASQAAVPLALSLASGVQSWML